MNKFSELGVTVQDERKMFNCQQVSISDVLNCETIVEDYIPDMKTSHGEGRYLVKFKNADGTEGKFFTNATSLKQTLDKVPKESFPFSTTIKGMKCGNGKLYQFT